MNSTAERTVCHVHASIVPVGKARPRVQTRDHRGQLLARVRAYTPAKSADFEAAVGFYARKAMQGRPPIEGPVELRVNLRFPMPPSWSKAKQSASAAAGHTSKPDLDNVLKALKDALNGVVYADDAAVVEVHARKDWVQPGGLPFVSIHVLHARSVEVADAGA